jgi:1-deoxy-D-xylulose-5-phosphate reductoisomerase
MKKKIAILGSTGSIGKSLINIINKDKKNFQIVLLTANKNYKDIIKQAKVFNVKNLIITNEKYYKIAKLKTIKDKINIYNDFTNLNKIFKKKIDYTMSSISGLDGLVPTLKVIKFTKKIAIANKEGLICGWNLLKKRLLKYNTEFLPVDSEHFSIWYALKDNKDLIDKVILTASGGPFYNLPLKKFKNIKISHALRHPNWKMGKKISIDSATMMNKVFEIIEAKNIFNLNYENLKILNHPKSYVHAIVQFNNSMSKIIIHDTDMKIPIFNTLYKDGSKKIKSRNLKINILNDLSLKEVDYRKFPLVKILKIMPKNYSLFETVIVSANDALVNLFLNNKIKFTDIATKLIKIARLKEFEKYKKIKPNKIQDIINLDKLVRLKIDTKSI